MLFITLTLPTCMLPLIYNFTSTRVVPCSTSCGKSYNDLHVMRHDISPCEMVYRTRDLAMEASYTIHENYC